MIETCSPFDINSHQRISNEKICRPENIRSGKIKFPPQFILKLSVEVFFAFKHVSAAAIFKPCVRKRDILTRFPQLSLDFSTLLHTNNNCTHYIRSTFECIAFCYEASKHFQEVKVCWNVTHFRHFFPFFFNPRFRGNDKNKKWKGERFGRAWTGGGERWIVKIVGEFRLLIERINCFVAIWGPIGHWKAFSRGVMAARIDLRTFIR